MDGLSRLERLRVADTEIVRRHPYRTKYGRYGLALVFVSVSALVSVLTIRWIWDRAPWLIVLVSVAVLVSLVSYSARRRDRIRWDQRRALLAAYAETETSETEDETSETSETRHDPTIGWQW